MMTPDEPFDQRDWDRRLDSGDRSDPLLDLAATIRELSPRPDGPSLAFQDRLRAHLLSQYVRQPQVKGLSPLRWVAWGLALLAVVVLAFAGLERLPGRVPAVSAAEVLERAGGRLSEQLAAGDVIYDRLILDWDQGGDWRRDGVEARLWRSSDGSYLRYQMVDNGSLLYLEQHDGKRLWRSSYVRPVEGLKVNFVYQAPYVPGTNYLEDKQLVAQLLFRDLSGFWIYIDQMAGAGRSGCAELFCALSSLGQGWKCSENRCALNLGPVLEMQNFVIEAEVARQYQLLEGREVYQVRLYRPGSGDQFYTTLKFDTITFDLLEIEDFWHGKLHYRINLVERKALAWSDLPEGFFQSVPEGIQVRPWASDIPLGHKEDDRVWIISADPPPGARLSGRVTGLVDIGYRLTSVEKAAIEVGLSWVGHDMPYRIRDAKVIVTAGEGTVHVPFTVDADRLGKGNWAVGAGFSDVLGIAPNTGWNSGGAPFGIHVEWCLHCPPAGPGP